MTTKRCEVNKLQYNPWVMGGQVYRRMQCSNKANWLVKQVLDDEYNKAGMTQEMCDECAAVFIDKKLLAPEYYTMDWIANDKT